MTSADLKFVPQAKAFAVDGEKNPSIPTTSTTAMNLATGFPSVYSKPLAEGGKLIQRKEMNTLFYQLMLFQNFLQNGGYITWNADVMNGIGGYPNGAVLSLIDSVTGAETRIQSCVDNNYLQPTAESIGAKYRVNTSTVPHTYTKDEGGNVIWRYLNNEKRTFTPLIDWDYENPTKYYNNANVTWKNTTTSVSYRSIYDDGRYAQYVYPLKEPFTNFEEIMICYPDASGGTPDQDTRIFKADVFDFLLNFPMNKTINKKFYSTNTPDEYIGHYLNLWLPYEGSAISGFTEWYQKSSPTRLVGMSGHAHPVLEIFGIK